MTADLFFRRSAEISDCGRYRWRLERRWGEGRAVCWIMLNPSTADGERDDPTIREIVKRSRRWGYGGLVGVNVCPLRATNPAEAAAWLRSPESAGVIGDNLMHVLRETWGAGLVICAWGAHPAFIGHARGLRESLRIAGVQQHHLGLTAGGHPKHPLARGRHRIHRDQKPLVWEAA